MKVRRIHSLTNSEKKQYPRQETPVRDVGLMRETASLLLIFSMKFDENTGLCVVCD